MNATSGPEVVTPARAYEGGFVREETSLFGFVNVLLKYRGMIALLVVAFGVFGTVKFLRSKPTYSTRISINVAATGDRASVLSAITGGGESSREVAFFTELLRSAPLLRETAKATYTVVTTSGTVTGPLARFYGFKDNARLHRDELTKVLTDNVGVTSSPQTGNMWITVDSPYPELSQQLAVNLVSELDDYSRKRRRAKAGAEREFIQGRVVEALSDLRRAETDLLEFRLENRAFTSPVLKMSESRLQRDVQMKQQLYTSLLQSYDRARIEEARDLPTITITESPERPVKPERSGAKILPLLTAVAGLLAGIVLAFIRERIAEMSTAPTPAFEEYIELKRETGLDLRNPLRSFQKALRPRTDG